VFLTMAAIGAVLGGVGGFLSSARLADDTVMAAGAWLFFAGILGWMGTRHQRVSRKSASDQASTGSEESHGASS